MKDVRELQDVHHYVFAYVNGTLTMVHGDEPVPITFIEFLDKFGINIPYYVKYCLIDLDTYSIKFRDCGSHMDVYVKTYKLNPYYYDVQTSQIHGV